MVSSPKLQKEINKVTLLVVFSHVICLGFEIADSELSEFVFVLLFTGRLCG